MRDCKLGSSCARGLELVISFHTVLSTTLRVLSSCPLHFCGARSHQTQRRPPRPHVPPLQAYFSLSLDRFAAGKRPSATIEWRQPCSLLWRPATRRPRDIAAPLARVVSEPRSQRAISAGRCTFSSLHPHRTPRHYYPHLRQSMGTTDNDTYPTPLVSRSVFFVSTVRASRCRSCPQSLENGRPGKLSAGAYRHVPSHRLPWIS